MPVEGALSPVNCPPGHMSEIPVRLPEAALFQVRGIVAEQQSEGAILPFDER